ncbi:ribbon-helix-helix domain-containing protein [Desulfovibrio sp. OttesenSCG-928-G11]|nr:ribbon-helix-helix domain-containing protein [Desulfovibrio sp. OttesenSCG-928-G11]
MHTNTTPASVKLPQTLRERVKSLADARNQSAHAIMLQAIESYVNREEQREALRQEARAAHDEYLRTGLHITAAEADAWLAELEAGNDVKPPKCHI